VAEEWMARSLVKERGEVVLATGLRWIGKVSVVLHRAPSAWDDAWTRAFRASHAVIPARNRNASPCMWYRYQNDGARRCDRPV